MLHLQIVNCSNFIFRTTNLLQRGCLLGKGVKCFRHSGTLNWAFQCVQRTDRRKADFRHTPFCPSPFWLSVAQFKVLLRQKHFTPFPRRQSLHRRFTVQKIKLLQLTFCRSNIDQKCLVGIFAKLWPAIFQ